MLVISVLRPVLVDLPKMPMLSHIYPIDVVLRRLVFCFGILFFKFVFKAQSFMALFLSTYTNKVDKKGRVSVPAPFRAALAEQLHQGIILFSSSQHSCLEGFDWSKMDEIGSRMDHYDLFSEDQDDLATTIFGESVQLLFDGEGRVTLPLELMEAAHIVDRVTFVGLGRKFQIWDPEMFARRKAQARAAVQDRKLTVPSGDA